MQHKTALARGDEHILRSATRLHGSVVAPLSLSSDSEAHLRDGVYVCASIRVFSDHRVPNTSRYIPLRLRMSSACLGNTLSIKKIGQEPFTRDIEIIIDRRPIALC